MGMLTDKMLESTNPVEGETLDTRKNITIWEMPMEKMKSTQWGPVIFREWCKLEMERVRKLGVETQIVSMDDKIALARV